MSFINALFLFRSNMFWGHFQVLVGLLCHYVTIYVWIFLTWVGWMDFRLYVEEYISWICGLDLIHSINDADIWIAFLLMEPWCLSLLLLSFFFSHFCFLLYFVTLSIVISSLITKSHFMDKGYELLRCFKHLFEGFIIRARFYEKTSRPRCTVPPVWLTNQFGGQMCIDLDETWMDWSQFKL